MSRRGPPVYEDEYYSRTGPPPPPPSALPLRTREREYDDVNVDFRREQERGGGRPEFLRDDYITTNDAGPMVLRERDTETFVRRRSPSPVRYRERYVERSPSPPQEYERVRMVQRDQSPPPQLRARVTETRERVRERSPSPVRVVRERYIERERERSPSPVDRVRIRNVEERSIRASPTRSLSPSPPPGPIQAPPIHQEVITHHRHIDHGYERARVPTPPTPQRQNRTKETDIDIYTSRNHTDVDITRRESNTRSRTPQPPSNALARRERGSFHDDSYIFEKERDRLRVTDKRVELSRRRSVSARAERSERDRVRVDIRDNESESDYYSRKANDRAYIGEGYNGATKDWAIVDVPPGTERVRMDGVGGGSQEISWQKYNGVRRSKFIPERDREGSSRLEVRDDSRDLVRGPSRETNTLEIDISRRSGGHGRSYEREYERIEESNDRRLGMPRGPKNRLGDLWTEITKDLVVREAIEELGYDFEETEYFYYVIQYLRYEDVLQLVQLSETIRHERQHRIREIEREREAMARHDHRHSHRDSGHSHGHYDDERILEREIIYNGPSRRGPRRSGGW